MPMSYRYNKDSNTIETVAFGVITAADLLDYLGEILDDQQIQSGFVELVDFEAVKDLSINYSEIRPFQQIWDQYQSKGCLATIVYSPSDVCYGITRMIQTVVQMNSGPDPGAFMVVRSREQLQRAIADIRKPGSGK